MLCFYLRLISVSWFFRCTAFTDYRALATLIPFYGTGFHSGNRLSLSPQAPDYFFVSGLFRYTGGRKLSPFWAKLGNLLGEYSLHRNTALCLRRIWSDSFYQKKKTPSVFHSYYIFPVIGFW